METNYICLFCEMLQEYFAKLKFSKGEVLGSV